MSESDSTISLPIATHDDDYQSMTTEFLQYELDFCKHAMEVSKTWSTFYGHRVQKVEEELERRFLFS